MSQLAQDVFASARAAGLLVPGFVGSFADVKEALNALGAEEDYHDPDEDGSLAYARYLESGWPGHDQYVAEEEADRLAHPFDRQGGYLAASAHSLFSDENDPDGEAWNAYCEQYGDAQAEAAASAWFAFPGDRH